jgi:hypothetical protein
MPRLTGDQRTSTERRAPPAIKVHRRLVTGGVQHQGEEGQMGLGWHRWREFEKSTATAIGSAGRAERSRVREEWGHLIRGTLGGLRTP